MGIEDLVDLISIGVATYKNSYKDIDEKFKRELKELPQNFLGKMLEQKKAELKEQHERDIETIKKEYRNFTLPQIQELRESELSKAKKIDTNSLNELKSLSGLPLSLAEINTLAQKYGGRSPYVDKMLAMLAQANGITSLPQIEAGIDVKMEILTQLEQQGEALLANFDGTPNYKTNVLLSDSVLANAETLYNGGSVYDLSDADTAKRVLLSIQDRNAGQFEKGLLLRNAMSNASEAVQIEMLGIMASHNVQIDNTVLELAGVAGEVEAVRRGDSASYAKAQELVNSFKSKAELDFMETEQALIANKDNPYLPRLIATAAKNNETIAKAALGANLKTRTSTYGNKSLLLDLAHVGVTDGDTSNNTVEVPASE